MRGQDLEQLSVYGEYKTKHRLWQPRPATLFRRCKFRSASKGSTRLGLVLTGCCIKYALPMIQLHSHRCQWQWQRWLMAICIWEAAATNSAIVYDPFITCHAVQLQHVHCISNRALRRKRKQHVSIMINEVKQCAADCPVRPPCSLLDTCEQSLGIPNIANR